MPPRPMTRTTSYLLTRVPTSASPAGAAGGAAGEEPGSVRVVMSCARERAAAQVRENLERSALRTLSKKAAVVSAPARVRRRRAYPGTGAGGGLCASLPKVGTAPRLRRFYCGSGGAPASGLSARSWSSLPSSSSASRSLNPPADCPLMKTCGTVRCPEAETSQRRRSCRPSTSISVKAHLLLLEEALGRGAVRAPGREVDVDRGAGGHRASVFPVGARRKARVDPAGRWG